MSNVRTLLGAVALTALIGSTCLAEEPKSLVGEWEPVSANIDGKAREKFNFEGMRWKFTGMDALEITPGRATPAGLAGKASLKCTYVVDHTKSPAHFNWTISAGEAKHTIDAIYELKDDVLRVCFAKRGRARPASFETKEGESIYEFKRVAKE